MRLSSASSGHSQPDVAAPGLRQVLAGKIAWGPVAVDVPRPVMVDGAAETGFTLEAPGARRPAPPPKWEFCVFDLSIGKILVLAVIALVIFGPDQLPKMAKQAGRTLRDLRRLAEGAKADLREGLGPEFADFEITDLNPKNFIRRQVFDTLDGDGTATAPQANGTDASTTGMLPPGERPPYDAEAT